ncbi:hypothetical protein Ahy_A05g024336 [Arachis hypogaea]|uniref:dUTP diphosphatase n=1 Tax=Arachis hypogaea TaxID=3818 RepID=A0A445D5L4_ARAHY|nr:hypothetical protein Ahy_A05g024336 [Arachis hypogaea]
MAFFVAAVIGFVYFGGSGDYGDFEPPFSHVYKIKKKLQSLAHSTPFFLLGLLLSPLVTISPETKIPTRGKALVATDLSISIPEGTDFFIFGFLGLPLKHWIDVGAGVIDVDYRRPVGVILFYQSTISGLLS